MTISLFDNPIYQETSEEFGDIIFTTSLGQLDESGIPPSLLYMKSTIQYPSNEINLQCHIKKPIKVRLTPVNLEKIFAVKDLLSGIFVSSDPVQETIPFRPISRINKIKSIKQQLFGASNIDLLIAKTDICLLTPNSCALNFSFFKFDAKLGIKTFPERLNVTANIDSMLINSEYSIILHPMTMNFGCLLAQDKWNKHLSTTVDFHSNYIGFQICPNDVLTIAKTQKAFLTCISRGFATFSVVEIDEEKTDGTMEVDGSTRSASISKAMDKQIPVTTPVPVECPNHYVDEYFQDDLRLGAFQYVDTSSSEAIPLPYQINMYTEDDNLKICWRYPHPRVISYMQVYPVPLQLSVNISCQLEYFLESQNAFVPFTTFQIDEKTSHELPLPKRKVTASIWRMVMFDPLAFTRDSDNEDYNIFRDMLHPRALIGCIRIDSLFSKRNIPLIQANVNIKNLSLAILNNVTLANSQMPEILKQYTLKAGDHLNNVQEYCRIDFPTIIAHMCLYSDADWTLYNELSARLSILDYSYLQMERLIEDVTIKTYLESSSEKYKGLNVCYAVVDKLHVKYGPYAGHTIAISDQIWREILSTDETKSQIPILTRFVVSNVTSVPFKFGQHETDEQIWLRPNECYFYAFPSTKKRQWLRIAVDSETEGQDDSAALFSMEDTQELQYIPINHDKILLVTQKKISTTQRLITIQGQISLMNMCKQSFQVHYKNNSLLRTESEDGQIKLNSQCVIHLNGEASGSVLGKCDSNTDHIIRLHLAGTDGNGWSGEIPLHAASTHVPWLVKVPTKSAQKFVSFSVRIHREFIVDSKLMPQKQQRLLIVIWPLLTARSLLPSTLFACDKEYDRTYPLLGKGQRDDFQIAGTFDTEHEFLFNLENQQSCLNDKWKTVLSYKAIDRKSFFSIPERFRTIHEIIKELEKTEELKWPCAKEEELSLERPATLQKSALPLYKFSPSRELSCSLMMDVLPWCLFINSIGCEIKLINSTDSGSYSIEPNHIAMPFMISTAFNIAINYESGWKTSCLIYLNDCKPVHRSQLYYKLPQEGSVLIEVLANNGLSKFHLTSRFENSTRIIILSPYFVVCNLSKQAVKIHPFCVSRGERLRFDVHQDIRWNLQSIDLPMNKKCSATISKGIGITAFQNLSQKSIVEETTERNMNYYLVVSIDECDFSIPILINRSIPRTGFSIRHESNQNTAFALTAIEYLGQIYVSIYNDRYPFTEIYNRTNIYMYIAEAESADANKRPKPRRSIHDDNFQWFKSVPPFKRINYTPPSVNENFPEKPISNVNYIFGCVTKLTTVIQWSLPLKVDDCEEKFLNLPLYGDIKLTLYKTSKTIRILIDHINVKTEFNVKNILTKLSSPPKEVAMIENDDDIISSETLPLLPRDSIERCPQPQPFEVSDMESTATSIFTLNTDIFFKNITITLFEEDNQHAHKKNEIVSVYLDDVAIFYEAKKRTVELSFGNVQVDNNLFTSGKYDFPVVLCGQHSTGLSKTEMPSLFSISNSKPFIQKNLAYFKIVMDECTFSPNEIHCNIKPFTAYVEDKFIAALLDFFIENLPANIVHSPTLNNVERVKCCVGEVIVPRLVAEQIITLLTDPLRISHISIKPLSILLSVHTCMR